MALLALLLVAFLGSALADTPISPPGPPGVFYNPLALPADVLLTPKFVLCANGSPEVVGDASGDCYPYTTQDIPLSYERQEGTNYPEQIKVGLGLPNATYYTIKFVLPKKETFKAKLEWGYDKSVKKVASCSTARYHRYKGTPMAYRSGPISTCHVGPVAPGARIYYRPRTLAKVKTVYSFKALPFAGTTTPLKFAFIADVGQTYNASSTIKNVEKAKPDLVLFSGDLTYADNYDVGVPCYHYNGTDNGPYGGNYPNQASEVVCGIGGLRWDTWGRLYQKVGAHFPTLFVPGNHELEIEPTALHDGLTPFVAFEQRIPGFLPKLATEIRLTNNFPPAAPRYWSVDVGLTHILGLSAYEAYGKYTSQWNFITSDVPSIDKTVTPWFFVLGHNPWYNTDVSHYLEGPTVAAQFESLFYHAGLDLFSAGHVHAYERSHPVYQYRLDTCGATYVTVGDGGNQEAVAGPFLLDPNGHRPFYSAVRDYYFGHAELEIYNGTTAKYTWYRNINGNAKAYDEFILTSKHSLGCPKQTLYKK